MKPFIAPATRTRCSGCGSTSFVKKRNKEFDNEIPSCVSCGERPELFRVAFVIPNIGGKGFKKIYKTTNHKGQKLDSPSRADAFCEYVREKISLKGGDFDPRELGTREEQDYFLIKNNSASYLKSFIDLIPVGKITPAGYAKKERVMRLYIVPLFGELSVKEVSYQVLNRAIVKPFIQNDTGKIKFTDSIKTETIKELSVFLKWCCTEGLIKTIPELPKKPKDRKFKPEELYNIEERDLVINNIKDVQARIAVSLLAVYTRRKSEVICLRWGDFNFKTDKITFSRHMSEGKGITETLELPGLKSSPDKSIKYNFFPGLKGMLFQLNPSLDPNELVFKGKKAGSYVHKNFFYEAWKESALELIKQKKLGKYCDLHRGTRSSTLTSLAEQGHSTSKLGQLYAGDEKTMNDFYIKQSIQNTDGLLTSNGLVK